MQIINEVLSFERNSYDRFIDFLKGGGIFFVVLGHSMPVYLQEITLFPIWGGLAVPIFLIIQVFHAEKRGKLNLPSFSKIWKRIIKPFVITQALIMISLLAMCLIKGDIGIVDWETVFKSGGYGPGAYYPFIYLQFIPIIFLYNLSLGKLSNRRLLIVSILISQLLEVCCIYAGIPEWLYRLLFIRYFFLIYIGYTIAKRDIQLSNWCIYISMISIAATLVMFFVKESLAPSIIYPTGWKTCHWFCYLYIPLFLIVCKMFYSSKYLLKIRSYVEMLGKSSYEIFMVQMFYFAIVHGAIKHLLGIVFPVLISDLVGIVIALTFSIIPTVYIMKKQDSKNV